MKGHLEIFEHRLKNMAEKLPNINSIDLDEAFLEFERELGNSIPFYDVKCVIYLLYAVFVVNSVNECTDISRKHLRHIFKRFSVFFRVKGFDVFFRNRFFNGQKRNTHTS